MFGVQGWAQSHGATDETLELWNARFTASKHGANLYEAADRYVFACIEHVPYSCFGHHSAHATLRRRAFRDHAV